MSKDNLLQLALDLSYFYLKFRPRTKKEVIKYLLNKSKKYHYNQEIIEKAINQLEKEDLINDKKFISWFVDQRNRTKPKSNFALTTELIELGIDKNLADYYFQDSPQDEETLAQQALERRWDKFLKLPKNKRFQKAASFLSRRGFNFETINKLISKLENNI